MTITEQEADNIVDEILEKRLFEKEPVSQFIKSTGKVNSNEDLIKVLKSISIKDGFFNSFFDEMFIEVAEKTDSYVDLILETSKNQKLSMVLPKLIGLYQTKPDIVEFLLEKFGTNNDSMGLIVGYLLGGIGEKDPDRIYSIIDYSKNPTDSEKISHALALRIIADKHKLPTRFVDKIISFSDSENAQLNQIAIQTMAWDLCSINKVQRKLIDLSRNSKTAFTVCNSIAAITKRDKKIAMRLFYACSKTNDIQTRRALDTGLGLLAPDFPLECLKIAKMWTNGEDTNFVYNRWFISEIGKGDIRKIQSFLLRWLRTEKRDKIRRYELPQIVSQIYSDKEKQILQLIKALDYKKKSDADVIVKILEDLLSAGYGEVRRTDEFVEQCNKILVKIARLRKIETNPDPTLKSPFMRLLALISAIEANSTIPDPKIVKKNLKYFPRIVSFLGKGNIDQIIKKKRTHPLVRTLQRVEPPKDVMEKLIQRFKNEKEPFGRAFLHRAIATRFYPGAYLSEIESALSLFSPAEQGMSSIRNGLLDEELFYDTLPELSLAARLKKKGYAVLLQPPVGQHKLDMKVTISKDLLIEVYSPHEDIRLKYVRKAHGMDNTAKKAVLKKLQGQIADAANQKLPIVLVIDQSNSRDVTEIEIADILFGTFTWNLVFDNQKHEVVKEYASRKQDSISDIHPAGKAVSAIILLKRDMDDSDLKIKLYGKIFVNPHASIPLDQPTIQALEAAIFAVSLS